MDTGIYTETLARLYLKQGFVEQALAIYRHLAQEQPENLQWQDTVMALEQQLLLSSVEQPTLSPGATFFAPPERPAPCCPTHVVIAQLERWLAGVQQWQHRQVVPSVESPTLPV